MNAWRKAFIMERGEFEFFVVEVPSKGWVVSISRDMEVVEPQMRFDSAEEAMLFSEFWNPTEDESWESVEDDE